MVMRTACMLVVSLSLMGCGMKNSATCWTQGEGSSVHGEFGYFYDSAEITLAGPTTFKRIPKDFTYDPCTGMPAQE